MIASERRRLTFIGAMLAISGAARGVWLYCLLPCPKCEDAFVSFERWPVPPKVKRPRCPICGSELLDRVELHTVFVGIDGPWNVGGPKTCPKK